MKKTVYLTTLLLLCFTMIHAQESADNEYKSLYLYHTSAQFQELDFNDFNKELDNLNLLRLPNRTGEIGAGVTRLYRRNSSGLTFVFGTAENELEDITAQNSLFRYAGIRISEAFNVLNPKSDWFLGPEVALNGSYQQILVSGRNNGTNFLEASANQVFNFERFNSTLDTGLKFHGLIRYNDAFEEARIVMIGVSGGYRFDNQNIPWNLKQIIALDNLGIVTGGWFGSLTFGVTLY